MRQLEQKRAVFQGQGSTTDQQGLDTEIPINKLGTPTMTTHTKRIKNQPQGEWLEAAPGELFLIRIPGSKTNDLYSVTEFLSSPGSSTPIHLHEKEDEYLLVLEGMVRVLYGDKTFDATAGTMVSLVRGIQHAWGNPTAVRARVIMTAVPGGCEEALREIAATHRDKLDLEALAKKYAVRNVGPPLLG
jgi:quercetin dioxygenase-like cupin family protein